MLRAARWIVNVFVLTLLLPVLARAAGTRVTGQVVDAETLAPIAGAEIELQNSGGGPGFHRAHSDAKGEFALDDVATNRYYTFTVGADGYTDWALESWQFPAAQREVRIVVPLDRAGRLAFRIVAADGRTPVAGARITLTTERPASWNDGGGRAPEPRFTDRAGNATFDGLRAGAWTGAIEASGLLANELRGLTVRRGESTPVAVTMVKPASILGSVRLADSTGVAGVNVVARGPGEVTATTDAGGFYTLADLPPGRWRIEVTHDGLEPGVARDGLVLREGESREVAALRVTPRPASLAFVLQREVFAPADKQQVGVRAFRLGALEMTLWRLPEKLLLDPLHDFRALYVQGADTTGLVRVESWRHELPGGAPFAWREENMNLPHEQPAGVYVLEGRSGRVARRVLFFVGDLGLVVKRSPTQTLVWAGSLRTGLPLAGVTVLATGGGRQGDGVMAGRDWPAALAAARGRGAVTDVDGVLVLPAQNAGPQRLVALSDGHGVALADPPLAGAAQQGDDRVFLFTERPIYRPGQVVDWKLFARRGSATGYTVPAAGDVKLTLTGPDQAALDVPPAKLTATGGADGTLTLPADVPLGDWTLSATWGGVSGSATLAVQQYRKPEYKVEVEPERAVVVNGDEVRFKLGASYYFGAAVVGATVRYTLFETRLRGEDLWESGEGEDGEEGGGYGRMLVSGETRTDVDGRAVVAFTPQRVAYDRKLALEVEVVDASQRSVSARGSVIVGRGLYVVRLHPVRPMFVAGQPLVMDVITQDHLGHPVQAAVSLEVDQDVWNPLERRYTRSSRPLVSVKGVTAASNGTTRLTVSPALARSGFLTVRAFSDDARGNRITAETGVWVFDEKVWSYPYRYPSLEAIADRDTFAPGDTARVLVNTDVKDAAVLVTVEGRDLHEHRVVHLFGNSGLIKIPLRPEYAPNVFVALHVRRGAEVHSRVLELKVAAPRHDLAITLTPDRAAYRPRERAQLRVETHDGAGKPVSAEVALGVVDEAIYALRADGTPDPHDVFYGRRPNWVTTVVSFPTLYYGGADKGDHGDVRRDFRDVALWAPAVTTGADGRAVVEVTFPDNLTTWRATARGVSPATLVGTAVSRTLVSKDVVARLAVPRAFVAGDEATLVSVVNNRTDRPLTGVTEAIEVQGAAKLTGPASVTSSMGAHGESRSTWGVVAAAESPRDGSAASAKFTFRARSAGDADALEQDVPVLPRAVPLAPAAAGVANAAAEDVAIALPADLVRSGSALTLDLSPSPAAVALASVDWLGAYPYGCTEQTANAILPACELLTAARAANVPLPGWDDPVRRLGPYVEHLLALRTSEQAWGWWHDNAADPYFTALAIDALAAAGAAGVQHEACDAAIRGAGDVMQRLAPEVRSVDGEAYCAMHLAGVIRLEDPDEPFTELRAIAEALAASAYAQRDRLGASGLACAALAQQKLGHAPQAHEVYAALMKLAVRDGAGLHFAHPGEDAWVSGDDDVVGHALAALAAIAPTDPAGPELVRALALRRSGAHWRNTRATGVAAVALGRWLATHPQELAGAGSVQATWNGSPLALVAAPAGGVGGGSTSTRLDGARLRPGANTLRLEHAGPAPLYWAWSARALVPSPGPVVHETRLGVTRAYLHVTRTTDRRGRPRWLTSPVDEKNPIRVGESILVRLTLTAPGELSYLMIEDPKPAGFEIEDTRPAGADRPWDTWAEARDDRAVFFLQSLDSGETAIEYLLRPEIAGAFSALPVSAGSMYDPTLLTRGSEARLRVVAK